MSGFLLVKSIGDMHKKDTFLQKIKTFFLNFAINFAMKRVLTNLEKIQNL